MARATKATKGATKKQGDSRRADRIQERFNRQVDEARFRITNSLDDAWERAGEVQSQAIGVWDDAVDYARQNPGRIVAVSLGLGLALGAYLRFRR